MIFEKVKKLITDLKGEDDGTITADTVLTEMNLDSLDIAELIMNIEDEFGISVDNREALKTVGDVVNFIAEKTGEK